MWYNISYLSKPRELAKSGNDHEEQKLLFGYQTLSINVFKRCSFWMPYGRREGSVRAQSWWKSPNQAWQTTKSTDWQPGIADASFPLESQPERKGSLIPTIPSSDGDSTHKPQHDDIWWENNESREHNPWRTCGDGSKRSNCLPSLCDFLNSVLVSCLLRRGVPTAPGGVTSPG